VKNTCVTIAKTLYFFFKNKELINVTERVLGDIFGRWNGPNQQTMLTSANPKSPVRRLKVADTRLLNLLVDGETTRKL